MKKSIKLLTLLTIIILSSSFTKNGSTEYIGTYGVSASDPSEIKLIINSDHSFYYQDFSIQDKKIIATGHWTLTGKKVVLTASGSAKKFHRIWTFEENGEVAKSRKGLTFYRLAKINS